MILLPEFNTVPPLLGTTAGKPLPDKEELRIGLRLPARSYWKMCVPSKNFFRPMLLWELPAEEN